MLFFFSSRRRHTRYWRDWSSDVCSSDLLRESLFDGIEVRGVGWQVQQLAAALLDQLSDPRAFVGRKVVHDHNLTLLERRSQHPLKVSLEDLAGGRTLHRQRRSHPLDAHAGEQRHVRSPVARDGAACPLSASRPGIQPCKGGVGRALVNEHEASGLDSAGHQNPPRSEEHTSELQSRQYLVCRLLLEKKKIR